MNNIVAGNLIIAPPALQSTNFTKSVIVVVGRTPTIGLVLNKPSSVLISDLCPNILPELDTNICWGGPENSNTVWMLHSSDWSMYNTIRICNEWSVTSNIDMFNIMARKKPKHWRVVAGCVLWRSGQLELELQKIEVGTASQGWLVAPSLPSYAITSTPMNTMWQTSLELSKTNAIESWL